MGQKEPNPMPDFNLVKPPPSNLPRNKMVELLISNERFKELMGQFQEIKNGYNPMWREHGNISGSEADSGFTQEGVVKLMRIIEELTNVTSNATS